MTIDEPRPIRSIRLADLDANPFRTRSRSAQEDQSLDALVGAIGEDGFWGCIEVRPHPLRQSGRFQIVAGHRRAEAARRAGLTTVPAQVVELSDEQMRRRWLRENVFRADITPWEKASALQGLRDDGMTYNEIMQEIGRDTAWIRGHSTSSC
jgi:ParB family chromosome partitioning protein